MHPGLLDALRHAPGVVLGGRDAAGVAGAPVDPVAIDVYLKESAAEGALDAVGAVPAFGNANVFAHIVEDDSWPFDPGQRHVDAWVAWLDLEDRRDRAAQTLLDRLIGGRLRA